MYMIFPTDWSPDYGGVISYIAKDADEEVFTTLITDSVKYFFTNFH